MFEFPIYCLFLNDAGLANYRGGWRWTDQLINSWKTIIYLLFSTDAFQFTLQVIANFPKSRWLTIFLKVANVLGLKLTYNYNININISVQDMTNHETNLRNHVLWHLKLFSGRLLIKIVERGKRKEETEKSSKCHKTWFRFLTTSVIRANSSIKNRTRTWFTGPGGSGITVTS